MASQAKEKDTKIFNVSQSPLQNSFFQRQNVSHANLPQRINQNYQFSFENMPKVCCHYHTDQYITMFCRSQTCQMPLCPQCIKIHSQEHQAYGSYGDFDTLENCLSEAYAIVANHCNKFVDELNHINKVNGQAEGVQYYMDKVKQARQQCYQVIDNFFNTLEAELAGEVEQIRAFSQTQSSNFSKYLQSRWKTMMSFLEKLNTEKCVKGLVKFYCSDFERENDEYFHESNQFLKQLDRCTPEVIIDQSAIYELNIDLAKFVSLKRIPQYNKPTQQQYSYPQQPVPTLAPQRSSQQNFPILQSEQYQAQKSQQQNLRTDGSMHPYLLTPPKTTKFYQSDRQLQQQQQ